jgi:hypothetical protein
MPSGECFSVYAQRKQREARDASDFVAIWQRDRHDHEQQPVKSVLPPCGGDAINLVVAVDEHVKSPANGHTTRESRCCSGGASGGARSGTRNDS